MSKIIKKSTSSTKDGANKNQSKEVSDISKSKTEASVILPKSLKKVPTTELTDKKDKTIKEKIKSENKRVRKDNNNHDKSDNKLKSVPKTVSKLNLITKTKLEPKSKLTLKDQDLKLKNKTEIKKVPIKIDVKIQPKSDAKKILIKSDAKKVQNKTNVEVRNKITPKQPTNLKGNKVENPPVPLLKQKTNVRSGPVRAKIIPEIIEQVNKIQNRPLSKTNVMNTIHNVTVASPPPQRKEIVQLQNPELEETYPETIQIRTKYENKEKILDKNSNNETGTSSQAVHSELLENEAKTEQTVSTQASNLTRDRTRTRTLGPHEVLILKNNVNEITLEKGESNRKDSSQEEQSSNLKNSAKIKDPIAFEINFPESPKAKTSDDNEITENIAIEIQNSDSEDKQAGEQTSEIVGDCTTDTDDYNSYEDDFESYESDFEAETSTQADDLSEENISTEEPIESASDCGSEPEQEPNAEVTKAPRTVISKEDERKLDSGNYEMKMQREMQQLQLQPQPLSQVHNQQDSLDTSMAYSDQLDSGISYSVGSAEQRNCQNSNNMKPAWVPTTSKRGRELMQKIQLDSITFVLFETKPMSYDLYMKIYGNYKGVQIATQTNVNHMHTDCQTEERNYRSVWTQHPPQYDLKSIENNQFFNSQNCCGEFIEERAKTAKRLTEMDTIDRSLISLGKFRKDVNFHQQKPDKQIDFNRLNQFLNNFIFTISGILGKANKLQKLDTAGLTISGGFYPVNTNMFNAMEITQISSYPKCNLMVLVHRHIDVEVLQNEEFSNLISVWDINESDRPIRILSTWSEICCIEICPESPDIVIGGLKDGSVSMWDLRECYSYSRKFDDSFQRFPATQIIAPNLHTDYFELDDMGAIVDVKCFRTSANFISLRTHKTLQFATLNDSGILTIWSLVETNNHHMLSQIKDINLPKHEYNSPWARIKLTQSNICDLRQYLELKEIQRKTKFDQTRSYFENDLFSDNALKELSESKPEYCSGTHGLRFTKIDVGLERVFVASNRNFIISCSKLLKPELFRRIRIDESKYLFPTCIRLLWNESFLIVGLSNGTVMAINCNQHRPQSNNSDLSLLPESSRNINANTNCKPVLEMESSKSCAIQNIVKNERKSYEMVRSSACDSRLSSASSIECNSNDLQSRLFDQQILLGGLFLRKDLVQNVEITFDGSQMLALMDGHIRVYDFISNKEISGQTTSHIRKFSLAKGKAGQQNLVLLTNDNDIQIHVLK